MDAFPQTKLHKDRETDTQTPEVIPQKQELTMFWREISSRDPAAQELAIMQMTEPYKQGIFYIRWKDQSREDYTHEYKFLGVIKDGAGDWHYQLENERITDRFKNNPEALAEFQKEYGVAYLTFPLNHKLRDYMGGPSEIGLRLPDAMRVAPPE